MTAFIGRLAAMSLSGSALILVLLVLSPLLRKHPALNKRLCRLAALRMLVPFAPAGQRFLRMCLAALPTPEDGFYLTAYRLAEFGAAQVVAFLWAFGLCAVIGPMLWAHVSADAPPHTPDDWLMLLVTGGHWFNPLAWRLARLAEPSVKQARPLTPAKKERPVC